MDGLDPEREAEAQAIAARLMAPKRRGAPRLARALYDAEATEAQTRFGSLAAWRTAPGSAVLLIHGWEDDHGLWEPMLAALAANGRPAVALDLPGHGSSEAPFTGLKDCAAAVAEAARELGPIDAVITHSFGGPVAIEAAARGLAYERAVLIAPPLPSQDRWIERLRERGVEAPVVARVREIMSAAAVQDAAGYDVLETAARMTARALVVHALDDDETPPESGRKFAETWPGASLLLVDALGYRWITQDRDVIRRATNFVDGLD